MADDVKAERPAPEPPPDPEYDAWFRAEVEAALREADDPNAERIPNEVVEQEWEAQRAELLKRVDESSR